MLQGKSLALHFRSWADRVCSMWHMAAGQLSGCVPCWALHFPPDCRAAEKMVSSEEWKSMSAEDQWHPWFDHHSAIFMLSVSCVFTEWIKKDWCSVQECRSYWSVLMVLAFAVFLKPMGTEASILRKLLGTLSPLCISLFLSEKCFVWTRCKPAAKTSSLKGYYFKGQIMPRAGFHWALSPPSPLLYSMFTVLASF